MAVVKIYTTPACPYCQSAKALLHKKGVRFQEVDVEGKLLLRNLLKFRARGRSSVPQIFIGGVHIGGCDDLYELDALGRLDPLLILSAER